MTPKFVVYECEECGNLFYRPVDHVITDDGAECHVFVGLYQDPDGDTEEFPMCECLGGEPKRLSDLIPAENEKQ